MYEIHGYRTYTVETEAEAIEDFHGHGVIIKRVSRERVIPWYCIYVGHEPNIRHYKIVESFEEAVEVANRILDEIS